MKNIRIAFLLLRIAYLNNTSVAAVIKDCNDAIHYAYINRANAASSFWEQFELGNTPPTVYQVLCALLSKSL